MFGMAVVLVMVCGLGVIVVLVVLVGVVLGGVSVMVPTPGTYSDRLESVMAS